MHKIVALVFSLNKFGTEYSSSRYDQRGDHKIGILYIYIFQLSVRDKWRVHQHGKNHLFNYKLSMKERECLAVSEPQFLSLKNIHFFAHQTKL